MWCCFENDDDDNYHWWWLWCCFEDDDDDNYYDAIFILWVNLTWVLKEPNLLYNFVLLIEKLSLKENDFVLKINELDRQRLMVSENKFSDKNKSFKRTFDHVIWCCWNMFVDRFSSGNIYVFVYINISRRKDIIYEVFLWCCWWYFYIELLLNSQTGFLAPIRVIGYGYDCIIILWIDKCHVGRVLEGVS